MVLEFQLNVAPMIKMFPALENSRAWAMMTMSKDKISKKTENWFSVTGSVEQNFAQKLKVEPN